MKKSGIRNNISHDLARIRIDSYNSLSVEEILTFHKVIILINSAVKMKNVARFQTNQWNKYRE